MQGSWLHLKAFAECSSKDGNTGIGHTHSRNEDLQPAKHSANGTSSIKWISKKAQIQGQYQDGFSFPSPSNSRLETPNIAFQKLKKQ